MSSGWIPCTAPAEAVVAANKATSGRLDRITATLLAGMVRATIVLDRARARAIGPVRRPGPCTSARDDAGVRTPPMNSRSGLRAPALRHRMRCVVIHRFAQQHLERGLVDPVAFAEIDRAPLAAVQACVEQLAGIGKLGPVEERELH